MKCLLQSAVVIATVFISAWNTSCTSPTSGDSFFPDNRITITVIDSLGSFTVVSQDVDDWQIRLSKEIHYVLGGRQLDPMITPAYPNPTHDSVSLLFSLGVSGIPSFKIYNRQGSLVKTLFRDTIDAGVKLVVWRLDDEAGHKIAPGFYRLVYSWHTVVCDGPVGTPCNNLIDVDVSGHGDIKVE